AHTHDGIQIDEFESATRRYPIYECLYNQEKICLCPAPVGSAAAVQVLEYLIAGGVTKIISVGSCGVLEDIPENRFLIPVSALRDEGTSYHYLPPSREVEISKAGINAIESALSQKNIPYWEVKTWTTDGFYRETVEMVQYRKEEGCQVVEMECSALAACAKFRKVTWAMLLFSADTLADPHKYQEREWGKTSISIALELALDAVLSVVEE
ncbi:TPA: nucleoside phosphorylase, partial [Campylobacter jejuni]|nr:nucleoside phosphorylase [Campylobacter jejuni]HEC1269091.1 nucleoside phosphorylase [Campylobacter jejuni]HEC1269093.1 nucleoside phosphorylase [Campylobacter jejuni]HEC1269094.1 nucleoside phosphorylase [Campylobacter jejuni]